MWATVKRFRWISWLAASSLAFQVLALALQTPMEIARGSGVPMAAAEHCGPAAGHHGDPASSDDTCQLCLGLAASAHAVGPSAPVLPLPPRAAAASPLLAAIEAPGRDLPTPQNPRAPPLPV